MDRANGAIDSFLVNAQDSHPLSGLDYPDEGDKLHNRGLLYHLKLLSYACKDAFTAEGERLARLGLLHLLLFVNLSLILHVNKRAQFIVVEYVENLELYNFP